MENYYLLGPDLKTNLDFEEPMKNAGSRSVKEQASRTFRYRSGAGRFAMNPKAILVNFWEIDIIKINVFTNVGRLWRGTPSRVDADYTSPSCSVTPVAK
jgi:phosphorylase/glycogen(starch) synthase